jgi:hypothetical protein
MDLKKSGGPAHPTLNGSALDDNTFRFEGMTLFDYYVGQLLLAGETPEQTIEIAAETLEIRNKHLMEK